MELTTNSYTTEAPESATISGISLYLSSIPAGFPSPASDYIEEKISLDKLLIKRPSSTFLVKVDGESMIEAFIPRKALLIVDKSITASTSDIIIAVVNSEFTVKRFVKTANGIFLNPANPKFKSIEITDDMDFKIWGVVISIIINPKEL